MERSYQLAADAVLLIHAGIVLFILFGLVLVCVGGIRGWAWIGNRWFRLAHLAGIIIVVFQAWLGIYCPLTILEMWLRQQAQLASYQESFIQFWVQRLLYHDVPLWVFAIAYTIFGALVMIAWFRFPPNLKVK
jgi:hypothetical protein